MIIGFYGLGLIGGSLAKSIRRAHPKAILAAYSIDPSDLDMALDEGIIDRKLSIEDPFFSDCDIIFLCAPVQTNLSFFPFFKKIRKKGSLLTDVGSVKKIMAEAAKKAHVADCFIGGHPMAGSEKSGFQNSTDYLLENAYYLLTPTKENRSEDVDKLKRLLSSLRALPLILSPELHDYVVAGVSHLPHIVAFSLVNLVKRLDQGTPEEYMKRIAAGGFRDLTRIASSSPRMWEQICLTNGEEIEKVLTALIEDLTNVRELIAEKNGRKLNALFTSSRNYRDSLNDSISGSLQREYLLYADIYDETGGIATITTLLAVNQVNIRNIGVLHNREFEEGILRIEFYDAAARDRAEEILKHRNYVIRKKK